MEPPFDELEGVVSTTSGYTDGHTESPTYEQVSSGRTGHAEAVQVVYDPAKVSFERLVEVFWRNIDPTDDGGQFCDRGSPYRPALFYHDAAQREVAERSRAALEKDRPFKAAIVTPVVAATTFYPAESGIPPGLLSEEPDPLQVLAQRLRPRPAAQAVVGRFLIRAEGEQTMKGDTS